MRATGRRDAHGPTTTSADVAPGHAGHVIPYPAYVARWLADMRASESLYATVKLFHASPHPMILKGADGRFVAVNRPLTVAAGWTEKAVAGRHIQELVGGCVALDVAAMDERLLLTRVPFPRPGVLVSADRHITRCRVLRIPWTFRHGRPGLALVMLPACEEPERGDAE